jgi:hypothetical protein
MPLQFFVPSLLRVKNRFFQGHPTGRGILLLMTNNEERIWDVLIEDALRESGAPAPMHEMGDRTRRLLQPVGPMGVDRGRSMRYTRHRWVRIAAGMLAVVLVLTILYLGVALLPMLSEANREQPQSAEGNQSPARQDGGESTPPAPAQLPKDTEQPGESPEPEPKPDDTPKQPEPKPEDTDEQPEPEPKPEDTVEQPKPEPKPEDTVEQPRPEPKPEDTVEQPKQPEDTTPEPDPKHTIRLLAQEGTKTDDFRVSSDREIWNSPKYLQVFQSGTWFRAWSSIDLEAQGVLLRLRGEARVESSDDSVTLTLGDKDLFVDNRGVGRPVKVTVDSRTLNLSSGAVLIERGARDTEVSVFDGEVTLGEARLSAGQRADLTRDGFGRAKPARDMEREGLLVGLANRVVYRENFDADPKGRLREGVLKDGVLTGGKVFWGYPDNIQYETGMVIRLRVRFTNAEGATLTQFAIPREDNFSFELGAERLKPGEWQVLEVPVDQFLERTTHKEHPNEVDWFQNVSLTTQGENAQVELDWVELIRAVK